MTGDGAPLRRVWVTRAEPGASATAARLSALGFTPIVQPLLAVQPLVQAAPDLTGVAALAFTSANGVRAFDALSPVGEGSMEDLPVFAVGDATARAARDAGFRDVRSARGDVAALAQLIRAQAPAGDVLLAGARERAGDLAGLVGGDRAVRVLEVYRTVETGVAPPPEWDAVLLHSPRAARALSAMAVADRVVVALSEAVAAGLGGPAPTQIRIARALTEDALIAALGKPPPRV